MDRFEATWRLAHPGAEPGPALRRSWEDRAWAQDRTVGPCVLVGGNDGHSFPRRLQWSPLGDAARDVLARLGARRSGWNAADVRGQVEQLIAASGMIAGGPARLELAEDLTARALGECVPLLGRAGLPEHIRALTAQQVLNVEADLTARFIAPPKPGVSLRVPHGCPPACPP